MDMPVNVPVDNPNADTEWNDILRKHGVIPEKPPSPTPIIEEAILEAQRKAHENRLEDKDLDELAALEDEEDEDFLEQYRQKRLNELAHLQKTGVHNTVYPLQKADYAREVTDASADGHFVLVLLTSSSPSGNVESRILTEIWRELASTFGDLKFCEIRADMCIEGYPERNTPTILVYRNGEIVKQVITLRNEFNGVRTKVQDLEQMLVTIGAVKENDLRLKKNKRDNTGDSDDEYSKSNRIGSGSKTGIKQSGNDGDDDDWD